MGNSSGKSGGGGSSKRFSFSKIQDQYESLSDVQLALKKSGLESSNLIIGIDFTRSNLQTGAVSFGGLSLHTIQPNLVNPYMEVISIVGRTLEVFDDDKLIPAFGFGDVSTTDKSVFPFFPPPRVAKGFQEVLTRYCEITPNVNLSGPTSFAPIVREAIKIVAQTKAYHILVIVCDGQVTNKKETAKAIVEASNYPLSIIAVGVGDGPWDEMERYDDELPKRKFDNFQFVPFNSTVAKAENRDVAFALAALQEIPDQFRLINKMGYLDN